MRKTWGAARALRSKAPALLRGRGTQCTASNSPSIWEAARQRAPRPTLPWGYPAGVGAVGSASGSTQLLFSRPRLSRRQREPQRPRGLLAGGTSRREHFPGPPLADVRCGGSAARWFNVDSSAFGRAPRVCFYAYAASIYVPTCTYVGGLVGKCYTLIMY